MEVAPTAQQAPRARAPEAPVILEPARPTSWHESTGELLAGVEVTDETDSMPGELFDELFNERSERAPSGTDAGTKAG